MAIWEPLREREYYVGKLRPFLDRGLVREVPTGWQLLQGQAEMMLYVVMPDEGDDARYDGAPMGHPLLRTPIVFSQIGIEHLRIGHGLHSSPRALLTHLAFVYHEGMPIFDLQLVQTIPGGLDKLRKTLTDIEEGATPAARRQRRLVDMVIPNAADYRRRFLEPGGWIDRCAAFDYPTEDEIPEFLRPEFVTLVNFVNHCAVAYPDTARAMTPPDIARHLGRLLTQRLRQPGRAAA